MNYWILKTEPSTYSFEDLLRDKRTTWDGVRNYQARNNLRAMKVGDLALIYHSVDEKTVVGLAKVVKEAFQDPKTDEDWSAVEIKAVKKISAGVTLAEMKKDKVLKNISLVKNSRLSVSPLSQSDFDRIIAWKSSLSK